MPNRLDLSQVTLVCFENERLDEAKAMIADMEKMARFGGILHLTEHRTLREFQHAEFNLPVKTSHIMTVHLDGFILNPDIWNPKWLQYDFIGAPWPPGHLQQFNPAWTHRVGNSGFSLRSKRLNDRAASLSHNYKVFDLLVSQVERSRFILEGYKFAPIEEAAKFSVELPCPETPAETFGFHGIWPLSENFPAYYHMGDSAKKELERRARNKQRVLLVTADGPSNPRTEFAATTRHGAESHVLKVLHRDAREIGDDRGCYFVKDILDYSMLLSCDVFVYVNNDVALVPEWREVVLPAVEQHGCYFSQRLDVKQYGERFGVNQINGKGKEPYIGSDVFAFTPKWWADHRDNFPDKVMLGGEGWDAILTYMMCQSGFKRGPMICYHEAHGNWWFSREGCDTHPAKIANREAQIEWAKKNGVEHLLNGPDGFIWKRGIFCLE